MKGLSFERRLSLTLAIAVVSVALIATLAAFVLSYGDAREFQDDTLRQVAAAATASHERAESPITVLRIPPDVAPSWLPVSIAPGLSNVETPEGRVRVFVRDLGEGRKLVVMQDTDVIHDVAMGSAMHTLVPTLLLIPLVAWLVLRVMAAERRELHRQRRFIADAAHELRSPLTALSLQVENIERAGSLDAARERLVALREGMDRARHAAEQILTLAYVQGAREPPVRVDIAELVRELIADAMPQAAARGIDLGLDVRGEPTVQAPREAIRLILKNGLDNALRYTPAGGAVTIRVSEEGAEARVEIEDEGSGIPQDARARAFEPFSRLSASGGGAGLGLAIAREAALRTGGSVRLADRAGGSGLVFTYSQRT